jgi:hypothetical protein
VAPGGRPQNLHQQELLQLVLQVFPFVFLCLAVCCLVCVLCSSETRVDI